MKKIKFLQKKNKEYFKSSFDFSQDLCLIDLSLEQLIESDFHLGCRFNDFDRLNFLYLFSRRFDFSVINLSYTLYNLKLAIYFLSFLVSRRGKVLFYDGSNHTKTFISFIGTTSKQYFVNQKWIAGLLTNFKKFYPAVFTGVSRHFKFPVENFSGMKFIHRPPNVTCLLNINREWAAFRENFRLGIPIISLINVNDNLAGITFPIFGNNLSPYSYITFFSILRAAILNGYKYEIYKFCRAVLKRLIKYRYIRHYLSRRIRNRVLIYQFRLYLLKLLLNHSSLLFNFFRFCMFPFYSSFGNLSLSETERLAFSEFYNAFPFLRQILLNFVSEFFFPVLNSLFSSDLYMSSLLNDIVGKKENSFVMPNKPFRLSFLEQLYLSFSSEQKFCNICFKLLIKTGANFFSNNFFFFIDLFLSRYIPLIFFLFKAFLNFNNKKIKSITTLNFLKTLRLLILHFQVCRIPVVLKSAKSIMQANPSVILLTLFLHESFPLIYYKSLGFPDLKTLRFLKIFTFNISGFPFSGFNSYSFFNLGKFVFDFKKTYGLFRYFKFSKQFKRTFRFFFRSFSFFRFFFRNVYTKSKNNDLFFDFKRSKYFKMPRRFVKLNSHRSFFKERYFNVSEFFQFSKNQQKLKQKDIKILNKYRLYLLAYFDEEFDTYKFPFNNEFFYLQVNYSSVFLARQFQRNRRLIQRQVQVSKKLNLCRKFVNFPAAKRYRFNCIFVYSSFFFDVLAKQKVYKSQ
jgi:small subunit ribosomal protein S2